MLLALTKRPSFSIASLLNNPLLAQFPFESGISRLNYKPDLFRFDLKSERINEITSTPKSSLSWEECCAERALSLLKLGKQRYYLSFSGGIDSTTALVAMLKYWPASEIEKIFVVMTETSILENQNFFDKYVSKLNIVHAQAQNASRLLHDDSVFLSGELGDQLFGSDILHEACEYFGEDCLHKDYKQFTPKLIAERGLGAKQGGAIFERISPIVEECPFPIRTMHDFFWWYNFTQKWQYVKFRHMELYDWDLSKRYGSHVLHFFDSIEFQKWSLQNHDLKIRKDWESYKFTAKEFIYEFTKHKPDLNLKKVQSLKRTYMLSRLRVGITAQFKPLYNLDDLKPYVR